MTAYSKPIIGTDRVVKSGPAPRLRVEAEKTRRAQEIGETTGLFRVPKVLAFDKITGRLELEIMPQIEELGAYLRRTAEIAPLMERIGRGIASVHDRLCLPDRFDEVVPECFRLGGTTPVVLHGDLTMRNIQVDRRDGTPVILDWAMMSHLESWAILGPREFDLAWFIRSSFFFDSPLRSSGRLPVNRMAESFLRGYFGGTDYKPDAMSFAQNLIELGDRFTSEVLERNPTAFHRRLLYQFRAARYRSYVSGSRFRGYCALLLDPR